MKVAIPPDATLPGFLRAPPRHLFFTGKGGVGKTSIACASAIALAETGRRVLLVSTDPASNLDEMLGVALSDTPRAVPGLPGLSAMNIDPDAAADACRGRVLGQMTDAAETGRAKVQEQLSGACTTEVAAFDEFAALLAGGAPGQDHVIFDTAPTGHTLRLLSLPTARTGFLEANEAGASCLGPHSGLKTQERRFRAAMEALGDASATAIVLVARPDTASLAEAARSSGELAALGLGDQTLVVNGVFHPSVPGDAVACAIAEAGRAALDAMPRALRALPSDELPLRGFDMVGLPALRALLRPGQEPAGVPAQPTAVSLGVGNGDDIAAAKRIILEAARGADGVLPDPAPVVRVAEVGDFAVQLELFIWIDPPQRIEALDVIDRVLERAKAGLTKAGIDLPYPTQQILFHDQTETTDGDRTQQREAWPAHPRARAPRPRWVGMMAQLARANGAAQTTNDADRRRTTDLDG